MFIMSTVYHALQATLSRVTDHARSSIYSSDVTASSLVLWRRP